VCEQAPTLLAAAGYTYNDSVLPAADGVNLWPAMMAEGDEPSPRDHVLLNVDQTNQVLSIDKDRTFDS
jgi:hypothetical protein